MERLTTLSYDSVESFRHEITTTSDNRVNFDLKQVAFELMNRCEEIFDSCEFKSYEIDCCSHFFPVFTETGFCYTFNSRHYEKKIPWNNENIPSFHIHYIKETDPKWSLKFSVKGALINMPVIIFFPKLNKKKSLNQPVSDLHPQFRRARGSGYPTPARMGLQSEQNRFFGQTNLHN